MHSTNCPRCGNTLSGSDFQPLATFCGSCGFIADKTEIDARLERNNFRFVIGFSLILVVAFVQLAIWGNHAIEIRWLQLTDQIGFASIERLERMAQICEELKKRDCVGYAYLRQSQIDRRKTVRLAQFQMSRGKYPEAVKTLNKYMAANKQDLDARMVYANALTETANYDEAVEHYEYLISKSQSLPSEAAKNYVKCLARARRYEQAEKVIRKIRRSYPGTARFMDGELRVLAGLRSARPVSKVQ